MNNQKSIMLCLENMGIGGVETYVINQAISLKKKGYNVIVVANNGIYVQKLKEKGIKFYNFEFTNKNYFDYDRIKILVDIIKNNNVDQVHINQFSLMTDLLPACLLTNTPYVTYLHTSFSMIVDKKLNIYDWFEKNYPIYKELFNLLFFCSCKIVAITQSIADYTAKRYNINQEKMIIIPNSISLDEYDCDLNRIFKIENILIIGRLREEKLNSIFCGIDLFKKLDDSLGKNLHLNIVGDGPDKKKVDEYIKSSGIHEGKISLLGAATDISQIIKNNDLVIGVDRCIIEAMASKRLAIIGGYDKKVKGIVNSQNILKAQCENFSGNNLNGVNQDELVTQVCSLNKEQIDEIVEYNYNFVKKNLDIDKNLYVYRNNNFTYEHNFFEVIRNFILIDSKLGKINECSKNRIEKNWKEHLEYKDWVDSRMEYLENEYKSIKKMEEEKNKELVSIYSSKSYKFIKMIKDILKR